MFAVCLLYGLRHNRHSTAKNKELDEPTKPLRIDNMSTTEYAVGARGLPLDDDARDEIAELVEEYGEAETAEMLSVSKATLARLVAGFGCYPATLALVRQLPDDNYISPTTTIT